MNHEVVTVPMHATLRDVAEILLDHRIHRVVTVQRGSRENAAPFDHLSRGPGLSSGKGSITRSQAGFPKHSASENH